MFTDTAQDLSESLKGGHLSRWEFVMRAAALGLSATAITSLLDTLAPLAADASTERTALSGQIVIGINSNPPDAAKNALTAAYKKHQPGVQLVWNTKNTDPSQYPTTLGTQLAASNIGVDIVSGNYQPSFRNYVNLDQYRKMVNPYTGHTWDQDLNWDFFISRNAAGERNMLPTQAVHINWFYNKNLFAKAGVQPPTTWAEFASVCAKLQAAGITPVASNFIWMIPQWFAEIYFDQYHIDWVNAVRAQPGDWSFDPTLDGKFTYNPNDPFIHNKYTYSAQRFYRAIRDNKLRFDTPQMTEIVRNMAMIFPRYATKDFYVMTDPYPSFLQQQVAIMSNGSWSLPTLQNDLTSLSPARLKLLKIPAGKVKTFEWGTFENPPMQGKLVISRVRSVESASGEYLSIVNKNQQQVNRCLDFLLFWTSRPGYQPYVDAYAQAGQFSPAGPVEVRGVEYPGIYGKIFNGLKQLGNSETSYQGFWTHPGGSGTVAQGGVDLFKSALDGKITPEQYARTLQSYIKSNFGAILKLASLTNADLDNPARQPGS